MYLPNSSSSSSSSSSNVRLQNLNLPVYNHLPYPNPSNLYCDNLQSSSNLFSSHIKSEIEQSNSQEKIIKSEEFGAITKTISDSNAVLYPDSVFCTDTENLNYLNAVLPAPVPQLATDSLFQDHLMPSIGNFVSSEEPAYLGQNLDNNPVYPHGMGQLHGDSKVAYHPQTTMYSYHPTPVPEVTQNVMSQNPQPVNECTKKMPFKKRKPYEEHKMNEVVKPESYRVYEDISYPAKRQMSIADLQRSISSDFHRVDRFPTQIKTPAARKLYPEGTCHCTNDRHREGYQQHDCNKSSNFFARIFIDRPRERSPNCACNKMSLTIETGHRCSHTPENDGQSPQNYKRHAPVLQSVPNNVQRPPDRREEPVYEPKPKRSRKAPEVSEPKRKRGRPRKNPN